ncbi:COX15/CtaA family protein [Nocardioides sp. REDSEA-S30_B4]|jgi:cytochrome c oxidase assembly protein subunit 15|uniref:COX15/CtaA family protein n=1 Tax=Nocardioides sp. REDSEA-S30_B4 TaxID=1811552 RepID=UPI000AD053F4|nr:COX15/CtaA family protein [Nocardioides sp. REDSEA-S30_B4]
MTDPALRHRQARWAGWASLVANTGIVVTGGAVRLTGSGLGCPTWPRCTEEDFTPHGALDFHSAIEFGNRLLTFVLVAVAVLTFVAAWRTGRRHLVGLAAVLAAGIPLQAVIGGITVLTDLNPWIVSLHLLLSMALVGLSVRFLQVLDRPTPAVGGPATTLAWIVLAAAWVVLYLGTVVTGSGPHAGDADSPRNGLDPLQWSQLHADAVFLYLGLTIGLLLCLMAVRADRAAVRVVVWLLVAQLAQGAIGFVQYFNDLPELLVGLHMLGAAILSALTTAALLRVRHPEA